MDQDMIEVLQRRFRQMYLATHGMTEGDMSKVIIQKITGEHVSGCQTEFSTGQSMDALHNCISLLIANIASLKDHLKAWCSKNGMEFRGEELVNSNTDVSIVHDLWNIDKHLSLNKPPRSGFTPHIANLKQNMVLTTGSNKGDSIGMTIDPITGKMKISTIGGGSASVVITADVIDENEKSHGDLLQICKGAIDAWEKMFWECGITMKEDA
ncbi:MAG: hypothetical protein ISS29_02020 [Candidatus Marinimicrobia bacterium]|nr:hypothetical protein [Candidatus Neomarinimicrobiota bacterium]